MIRNRFDMYTKTIVAVTLFICVVMPCLSYIIGVK
jgi:hypothetical protein